MNSRKSEFIPSTVDSAKYQGKYWAIPFNTNAGFLYYRTDKVKQAPKTWQDVYRTAAEDGGLVYQGSRYEGLTVNFLELLYSAGGKAISDDGKKATIDSPEAKEVLQFMATASRTAPSPKAVSTYMEEESRRAFEAGKASLERNGRTPTRSARSRRSRASSRSRRCPAGRTSPGGGVIGGYNLGDHAYSKNPDTALAFAEFVTQPKQQSTWPPRRRCRRRSAQAYDDAGGEEGACRSRASCARRSSRPRRGRSRPSTRRSARRSTTTSTARSGAARASTRR